MTPYISHRNTFIIFIISINIVSVVCLYEPIKEISVINDQRKFTYFNYLRAPNKYPNTEKLDVDQYYYAYYSEEYWKMPSTQKDLAYVNWKIRWTSYCNEEYVSHSHFVTTYHVAEFGNIMNNLRKCLNEYFDFQVLKLCCGPDHSEEPVNCLAILEQRDEVTGCFEPFKKEVLDLFGKKPEDLEFTESYVGKRAVIAFAIATAQEYKDELCDENFEHLLTNYLEFTGDTKYTNNTDKFKKRCLKNFNKLDLEDFDEWHLKYNVFKGFDNFKELSRQIKISLKYLEGIEGKLVNNKKLYDTFHENPISEDDYRELFTPLPLKHENFYPLFTMRLKFLGYVPVNEQTWNKQMIELRNPKSLSPSFFQALGNKLGFGK